MKRPLLTAAILAALAILLPGTATAGIQKEVDPAIADGTAAKKLNAATAKWISSNITEYWFRISASCFCPQREPVEVMVRNGQSSVSDPDWFGPRSVPELFEYVDEAIKGKAARLDVKYREEDGVPTSIYVDRDRRMVEEEMSFTVTGFTDLEVDPEPPVTPQPGAAAANRKQAAAIARKRIKSSSKGRSWRRGHGRSVDCRPAGSVFVCRAKWTYRDRVRSERVLVRRKTV